MKNGCSLFCVLEQRADRETLLSQQQGWFFNGSDGVTYVAPHPPFQVTSYDLDGHQMSQVPNPFSARSGEKGFAQNHTIMSMTNYTRNHCCRSCGLHNKSNVFDVCR